MYLNYNSIREKHQIALFFSSILLLEHKLFRSFFPFKNFVIFLNEICYRKVRLYAQLEFATGISEEFGAFGNPPMLHYNKPLTRHYVFHPLLDKKV